MNKLRRMAKLGLVVVLGMYLSGCMIVPLHGWGHGHGGYGHGHGGYDRGGYGHDRGGYGDRH